jgi:hypothetical protein
MNDGEDKKDTLKTKEILIEKSRLLNEGISIKSGERIVVTVLDDETDSE